MNANLIIFPIMLYHFHTVSATFLISNLLVTPILAGSLIIGLVYTILLILGKPIAKMISYLLIPLLQILTKTAKLTSKIPFSQIILPIPTIGQISIYYLLLFLIFQISTTGQETIHQKTWKDKIQNFLIKKKKGIIIVLIFILLVSNIFPNLPSNTLKIYFIDVRTRR